MKWTLTTSQQPSAHHVETAKSAREQLFARTELGFLKESLIQESLRNCLANQSFFQSFKNLVVVGVGGSSLGARALSKGLHPVSSNIFFLDNVDSDFVDRTINQISDLDKTLWLLCSKSGSTAEVMAFIDYINQTIIGPRGLSWSEQAVVVTEQKQSPLANFAADYKIMHLPFSQEIGGRFSVFTPMGLIPMLFAGEDLNSVVPGFRRVLQSSPVIDLFVGFLLQQILSGQASLYSFQYSDRLGAFGLWLQQLWSESLGKAIKRDGKPAHAIPAIIPCRGSSDQHSVLQQVCDGPESKFVGFHRLIQAEKGPRLGKSLFAESLLQDRSFGDLIASQLRGTRKSLQQKGLATFTLEAEQLNLESFTELLTLWMVAIGCLGEALAINAFDQPGVESSKVLTRRVLQGID